MSAKLTVVLPTGPISQENHEAPLLLVRVSLNTKPALSGWITNPARKTWHTRDLGHSRWANQPSTNVLS